VHGPLGENSAAHPPPSDHVIRLFVMIDGRVIHPAATSFSQDHAVVGMVRNTKQNLPSRTSSPLAKIAESTGRPLT
jgi:hypothetical protein